MKNITMILILLLISACAKKVWMHESKNQQEFYQDNSKCLSMSGSAGSTQILPSTDPFTKGWNQGSAINAAGMRNDIYYQCMMGQGWQLVEDGTISRTKENNSIEPSKGYICLRKQAFTRDISPVNFGIWLRKLSREDIDEIENACLENNEKILNNTFEKFKSANFK